MRRSEAAAHGAQSLVEDLLGSFTAKILALADRNFLSRRLVRDVLVAGAHVPWRASTSFTVKPMKRFQRAVTYLAVLKPVRDGPPITVAGDR